MAVQWVAEWRVNPGRRGDAMAVFSEYKQNAKRLGVTSQRAFAVSTGGDSPFETLFYVAEFDSMQDYGAYLDRAAADAEMQAAGQRNAAARR